ncbi:MAG TPA: hypothetical protein VG167_09435 [Verrucomicrobiae bacterium]|nr:hypothetical protein [Verrucomicrobiae bacterium]
MQLGALSTTNDAITACWGSAADSAMQASNTNGAVWRTLSGSNNFLLVYHLSQTGFPFAESTLHVKGRILVVQSAVFWPNWHRNASSWPNWRRNKSAASAVLPFSIIPHIRAAPPTVLFDSVQIAWKPAQLPIAKF